MPTVVDVTSCDMDMQPDRHIDMLPRVHMVCKKEETTFLHRSYRVILVSKPTVEHPPTDKLG